MPAALADSPVTEGPESLEVRWIVPGLLEDAVARWFGHFPAEVQTRADTYLLAPRLSGLSVKIRDGAALDVKVSLGSPGNLDAPGPVRGRLESWRKWSFPCGMAVPGGAWLAGGDRGGLAAWDHAGPAGWQTVCKRRRITRFSHAGRLVQAGAPHPGRPGCTAELTEIRAGDEPWWSVGLEATGPAGLLRRELEATAALVFARALPAGAKLGPGCCWSYGEWLRRRVTRNG